MRNRNYIAVRIALSLTFAVMFLLLTACGGGERRPVRGKYKSGGSVNSVLKAQYSEWKGVRYRMGGLSKKGIDCSGFVHLTFKQRFGRKIPRSTKTLAKYGKTISRGSLRAGDLVFFKTGARVRHVGIYYGGNRFLHASTSKGVMISRMDDVYWGKRYWQARRVM